MINETIKKSNLIFTHLIIDNTNMLYINTCVRYLLYSVTNHHTLIGLSMSVIIMTAYQSIRRTFPLCHSMSVASKKPEPPVLVTGGRNVLPAWGKKFSFHHYRRSLLWYQSIKNEVNRNNFITNLKHCKKILLNNVNVNLKIVLNCKIWLCRILLSRAGDVEMNPGPDILLATQNCRGLKKGSKLKQLLNKIQNSHSSNTSLIFALQETHIDKSYISYQWAGNHVFTPGNGHQGGVITLLSENIEVVAQLDIGTEAHLAKIKVLENAKVETMIIVNIHAPCAHNQQKINFFKDINEKIGILMQNENSRCKIILLGDFNTAFSSNERINTIFSDKEYKVGCEIRDILKDLELIDCWDINRSDMTWRHGAKMSRIDRILWSQDLEHDHRKVITDWTYTESDHAAVITHLSTNRNPVKERIVRIDTRFMQSTTLKHLFLKRIKENMDQINDTNMNPHQKLEFLKMSIRSSALEISANEKKRSDKEMKDLKDEITFWQRAYENDKTSNFSSIAMSNLNTLFNKRDKLLNDRGEYLSQRVKTKWYQEGEKSTKYFLNLQRARARKTEMHELMDGDRSVTDSDKIKKYVEQFYKKLYEKGDSKLCNRNEAKDFLKHLGSINKDQTNILDGAITDHELLDTLNTCSDSAPGPDGIPYSIIKLTWNYFGKALIESWEYAQLTGTLTHSHESSYLRLLPKEGKDQSHLKNWRPITLSNCDLKIITKTLSRRLARAVGELIDTTQTAYIPGRQITDNLHLMLYTIENSVKEKIESMIVSLDAEKAFDSVEHWYIREVMEKMGFHKFIKIFDLMYKNQMVDIILNGEKAGSYQIKNGVKQGDALSCILFIMCMEPLIKNIKNDTTITPINDKTPKIVAYADDISCLIKPTGENLKGIFKQYGRLTNVSGLKLNADKTEIITSASLENYEVNYQSESYKISPKEHIKINGIIMGYDTELTRKLNIDKMYTAMDRQLRLWSNRGLTILGKIQIYKTFGLSQLLYIGSVLTINIREEKKLDELIYRFIWNRDILTNKAPDRLKRSILKRPISELGFGMIDFREIIKSIRIKTIVRILNSISHPLKEILMGNLNGSWVNIKCNTPTRDCLDQAIADIAKAWKLTLNHISNESGDEAYKLIGNEYIGNLLEKRFQNKRLGLFHRHDTIHEIFSISRTHPVFKKLHKWVIDILDKSRESNQIPNPNIINYNLIPLIKRVTPHNKLMSKQIRVHYQNPIKLIEAKILKGIETQTLISLGRKIKGLTNTKLKTILLRSIHGDIYCGTRLKRFGMTETEECQRCGQPENIEHLLYNCDYSKSLWHQVGKITGIKNNSLSIILGCDDKHDKTTLTIHAELIRLLLAIERPTTLPKDIIRNTLLRLNMVEKGITKYQVNQMLKIISP